MRLRVPVVGTAVFHQGRIIMDVYRHRPKEAYRAHPAILLFVVFASLLLEVTLPPIIPAARLLQLPLLVTIYFSMIRENQIFGTAFGMSVGILEDALSHGYLGQLGMAKALVGYLAATAGLKLEFDNLLVRGLLVGSLVLVHNGFLYLLTHQLLGLPSPFKLLNLATTVIVNVALSMILFPLFDRLKKQA
ncbi:MAG TPA: rod shape-determining protein MreD [Terriglobia bacterium]|nr:rod shape-determining protein MreD [Terriglobia bacterium]